MEIVIRKNIEKYMQELKNWLDETATDDLEEMGDFFTARIGGYEQHMSIWEKAYQRMAELVPSECRKILDLGCGTGLELEAIWNRYSNAEITGVDLCQSMLEKLVKKYPDKPLRTVCEDYFCYDMGTNEWDSIVSFESLHHFLPEQKRKLYLKIYQALKKGGSFILADYIACCREEEEILRKEYLERRKKSGIPEEKFIHFDIPLTLEHETEIIEGAGFSHIEVPDSINGVTFICAKK